MSRYAIDVAGVAQVTRAVSADLSDAESAVTRALEGAAEVSSVLGSMSTVRGLFDAVVADRQRTGPGMVVYAQAVLDTAQRNTLTYIGGDEEMAANVAASPEPSLFPGRGFGPRPI